MHVPDPYIQEPSFYPSIMIMTTLETSAATSYKALKIPTALSVQLFPGSALLIETISSSTRDAVLRSVVTGSQGPPAVSKGGTANL